MIKCGNEANSLSGLLDQLSQRCGVWHNISNQPARTMTEGCPRISSTFGPVIVPLRVGPPLFLFELIFVRRHSSATHKSSTRCIVLPVCECPLSALNYAEMGMRMAPCVCARPLPTFLTYFTSNLPQLFSIFPTPASDERQMQRRKKRTMVQLCATCCGTLACGFCTLLF